MIIKNFNILENKIYPNKIKFISFYFSYHAHIPLTFVSYSCKKKEKKILITHFSLFLNFYPNIFLSIFSALFSSFLVYENHLFYFPTICSTNLTIPSKKKSPNDKATYIVVSFDISIYYVKTLSIKKNYGC